MNIVADREPHVEAVEKYMSHKGYPGIKYERASQVDEDCWYFEFRLPEGRLEVEVDVENGRWEFTSFWLE